ncbi:MarR family transcriptional regulator [Tenacibaculum sp. AHE15PA]|uniref:MarR family winged helix-turn-helix transcriptional regulator n=1 Tax=unclassified Tenacibaculum TaxID=2635139 RepID=UPI001C4E4CBB|nr:MULTISPECIES: MarR family transcriptional regulator [unclassified Tenacibaculum]QXP74304.1 MarR family transcriptional regulator [Tenacibaculum sp. AHE14PA]QXP75326.1 MarR family transcriptional regulator [Tenacibaculum sp. AHE15PA]
MEKNHEQLKLENQICFPLYSLSRLLIQQYKPLLEQLDITYPQYLVLLVLWEENEIPVKKICEKLLLETNTLTPLLKRMETNGFIKRTRSKKDERMVIISLTQKGNDSYKKAIGIPKKLIDKLDCFSIDKKDMETMKNILDKIITTDKNN